MTAITQSADGKLYASADTFGQVILRTAEEVLHVFSLNGQYIISGDARGAVGHHSLIVWDMSTGAMIRRISVDHRVYALSLYLIPLKQDDVAALS
jgi:tRNA A37 threonylcarbamoyladenosine synthetase subunit TsaC/SUA5/YrdC